MLQDKPKPADYMEKVLEKHDPEAAVLQLQDEVQEEMAAALGIEPQHISFHFICCYCYFTVTYLQYEYKYKYKYAAGRSGLKLRSAMKRMLKAKIKLDKYALQPDRKLETLQEYGSEYNELRKSALHARLVLNFFSFLIRLVYYILINYKL